MDQSISGQATSPSALKTPLKRSASNFIPKQTDQLSNEPIILTEEDASQKISPLLILATSSRVPPRNEEYEDHEEIGNKRVDTMDNEEEEPNG
jgi:hypothetical protein